MNRLLVTGMLAFGMGCRLVAHAQSTTTVLVDSDHRKTLSLNGDWHYIVDPYDGGLYNFHREIRKDGFFLNGAPETNSEGLVEYDFSKSPTLKVPGDWNTQHDSLFNYEGLALVPARLHLPTSPRPQDVSSYRSGELQIDCMGEWDNRSASHEGGFTDFDCDISTSVHAGKNFVVIAVDNTRLADGVPTLNMDWWNYGGLTRDVSLIDVPSRFIDDYDLHLNREQHGNRGQCACGRRSGGRAGNSLATGVEPQRLREAERRWPSFVLALGQWCYVVDTGAAETLQSAPRDR